MRQLFFISPTREAIQKAMSIPQHGANYHVWNPSSADHVIGVVEMHEVCDAERVIKILEDNGIMWMPNHLGGEKVSPDHATAMKDYGVLPSDTTSAAMSKVHAVSGFEPLKPKRF